MKLSIIIPAYNEGQTIAEVVRKACRVPLPAAVKREIVAVDDGSTDDTLKILRRLEGDLKIRVVALGRNLGKTGALLAGIEAAEGEYVLFQDADLEYDPVHYQRLLKPLLSGESSVIFGSRFLGTIRNMRPLIYFANRFSTWAVNLMYGAALTDVNTGFKVLPRSLFKEIQVTSRGFGGDAEITARLLQMKRGIIEVPIHYVARSRSEGKKMNCLGAIHMFSCFLLCRFEHAAS